MTLSDWISSEYTNGALGSKLLFAQHTAAYTQTALEMKGAVAFLLTINECLSVLEFIQHFLDT